MYVNPKWSGWGGPDALIRQLRDFTRRERERQRKRQRERREQPHHTAYMRHWRQRSRTRYNDYHRRYKRLRRLQMRRES
jgi:hypothetical protein